MNFSNFTKISSGNLIYFRNESPIENAGSLKFYKDNASGAFVKKEFRWSFDRNYWASWMDLNIGNIAGVKTSDNRYLFFEIKYTMTSPTAGKVSSFSIEYLENSGQTFAPPVEDVNMDHNHTLSDGCNDLGGTTKTFKVVTITNAETLCGKTCDFYLWRSNHKGFQPISSVTDLQATLDKLQEQIYVLDPSTTLNSAYNIGGGTGVFSSKDVSARALVFKSLLPGNLITISDDPSTITINVSPSVNNKFNQIDASLNVLANWNIIQDGSITYLTNWNLSQDVSIQIIRAENRWNDPDPISANVGGLNSGDTLDGSTSIAILEKMLYEYFPPVVHIYLSPSSGYYEKWNSSISPANIFGSFNNTDFVKVRVTDISAYVSVNNGSLQPINIPPSHLSYPNVSDGSFSFNDGSFPNWENVVYHIKIDNNVNGISMPIFDVSVNLDFVEPYIYGLVDNTINIGNITPTIIQNFHALGQKIISPKKSNEVTFTRDPSMFKIKFVYAYPASYGDLSSIFDVKNDFNVTSSFDSSILDIVIGASSSIPYKIYIKSHWIDVASFKLIFNI